MRIWVRFVKRGKVWREAPPYWDVRGDKFALRRITNKHAKKRPITGTLKCY